MLIDIVIQQEGINFLPSSTVEEIIQNVKTLCATIKGTVPLDRELGIDPQVIDLPVMTARARISAQIAEALRRFESRAEVAGISFREAGADGEVLPVVSVRIKESVI